MVRTIEEAADRHYSYVICAFKAIPEVITTPALLAPLLARLDSSPQDQPTTFVLLQNGIGIEDDLQAALANIDAPSVVISGCCWVDTTLVDGGKKIVQHGNERLVLGYHRAPKGSTGFDEETSKRSLDNLCDLFRAAGGNVEAAPDVDIARWRKVLWCCDCWIIVLESLPFSTCQC